MPSKRRNYEAGFKIKVVKYAKKTNMFTVGANCEKVKPQLMLIMTTLIRNSFVNFSNSQMMTPVKSLRAFNVKTFLHDNYFTFVCIHNYNLTYGMY